MRRTRGLTLVIITHDLGVVAQTCDRVAVLYLGRIVEEGDPGDIFLEPHHPYTRGLLKARPGEQRERTPLAVIPGAVPADATNIEGCAFRERCAFAMASCRLEDPAVRRLSDRHRSACHLGGRAMTSQDDILLDVRNLAVDYPTGTAIFGGRRGHVRVLEDISLRLRRGETLGVVGESGCGKSTLAMALARFVTASHGDILFDGRDVLRLDAAGLRAWRRDMQLVFQNPQASLNPRMTVRAIVSEPLVTHTRLDRGRTPRTNRGPSWRDRSRSVIPRPLSP